MSLIINGFGNAGKKCQHLSANKPKSLNFMLLVTCICYPAHGGLEWF